MMHYTRGTSDLGAAQDVFPALRKVLKVPEYPVSLMHPTTGCRSHHLGVLSAPTFQERVAGQHNNSRSYVRTTH